MPEQESNKINLLGYEALRTFALAHNYNKWIYELFKDYTAGKNILEIGCGIGNLTQYFLRSSAKVIGIDTSAFFIQHLRIDCPGTDIYNFDITDDKVISLSDKKIDAVVSVNVLEHVRDDEKALRNIHALLQLGGYLLLFVPALNWLFGTLDENVSHYRRYEKKGLCDKVERNGFTVEKSFFSNFPGIFGWFINSRILKRKHFPILQPIIFDKFVPLISKIEARVRPPLGMNLIIIARKINPATTV